MIIGIVAIDAKNGIGINGQLPWPKLKEDLQFFKSKTQDNCIIMGSTTWKSLGSIPLPNRVNTVVSRYNKATAHYCFFTPAYGVKFLTNIFPSKDTYIIGGQKLYDSTFELVDKWYITEIDEVYECDTYFNFERIKTDFPNKTILKTVEKTELTPSYTIVEYTK